MSSWQNSCHGHKSQRTKSGPSTSRLNQLSDPVILTVKTATSVLLARLMQEHGWENPTLEWLSNSEYFASTFTAHPDFLRQIPNAPTTIHQTMIALRYMLEYCLDTYKGDSELLTKMSRLVRNCAEAASTHMQLKSIDSKSDLDWKIKIKE